MPTYRIDYSRVPADETKYGKGFTFNSIAPGTFDGFNPSILGLGNISTDGQYVQSMAAFLDLEGFTEFCNQVDSHLVIPEFMQNYLAWIFQSISNATKEGGDDQHVRLWGALPFYVKFLGDGLLFLWDTELCGGFSGVLNTVQHLLRITQNYREDFLPKVSAKVSNPPRRLRCGIARGQIISIGNGEDYVGSCINVASRLQKISDLSFAISRRGFDLEKLAQHPISTAFTLKKYKIRGIGNDELVWIRTEEFDHLKAIEKKQFTSP